MNAKILYYIGQVIGHTAFSKYRTGRHLHLALGFKKNMLLAIASNDYKSSSARQRKFAKKVGKPQNKYDHAEIALLNRKLDIDTVVVLRIAKDGKLLLSKPCEICQAALEDYGIKKIIYSGHNALIEEKIVC